MKRAYESPEILFEDFSMSVNIAGNCDVIIDGSHYGKCGLSFGRKTYFVDGITGCTSKVEDGDTVGSYDQVCYHVPIDTKDLFNS